MGEFKRKLEARLRDKRKLGTAYPAFYSGVKTAEAVRETPGGFTYTPPADPPNKPDKGQFDGSCNRTACQVSIAGLNWFNTSTRRYYCGRCADLIDEWNVRRGEPRLLVYVEDPNDQPPYQSAGRS